MAKISKNRKRVTAKVDASKVYSVAEASQLVKDVTFTKFDSAVDLDIRLGVDPRKANQMVRGIVTLPHGTGKNKKVLVKWKGYPAKFNSWVPASQIMDISRETLRDLPPSFKV